MATNNKLRTQQLGIWTFVTRRSSFLAPSSLWDPYSVLLSLWTKAAWLLSARQAKERPLKKNIPDNSFSETWSIVYLYSFMKDLYSLGPFYLLAVIITNILLAACAVAQASFSGRVLELITWGLQNNQIKVAAIARALASGTLVSVLEQCIQKMEEKYSSLLCERVKYHFLEETMRVVPTFDPLTAQDPEILSKFGYIFPRLTNHTSEAVVAFSGIKSILSGLLSILSEMSFLASISQTRSTLLFSVIVCMLHPLLSVMKGSFYSMSYATFCNNPYFTRMAGLNNLAFDETFLEDRLGYDLGSYITDEFKKSRNLLGDTCTDFVSNQWLASQSIYFNSVLSLSRDSLSFLALRVLWDHNSISLGEFITIQQLYLSIRRLSSSVFWRMTKMHDHLHTIQRIYTRRNIQRKVEDGSTAYPPQSDKVNLGGAKIEFRNVTFKYPGTDKDALTDVSFKIEPGQVVVIVGINGSGKSSAIKLLTRLYDPTSGEILLDGLPLPSYRLSDIRRSMAVLRQNHPVFPLSLRENVSLGLPDRNVSEENIEEAMRQGGSETFVRKQSQGLETILHPERTVKLRVVSEPDAELKAVIDGKEQWIDISGGESQRLAASRTFLRLLGGDIRLLVADEPTSALDPVGEYQLFSKLRKHCSGKTAIFITHRFGHLTKHADLILCLKDGCLVEQGNHEELISLDGEYKRLYDVQASAFISD